MLSYNEAFELIKIQFEKIKLETETVKLEDSLHRTLAEEIVSDLNLPPFDNSAVDGFAIIHNEKINLWNVTGEISAGNFQDFKLSENQAIKIMTGAKMPSEANAVIPIENVEIKDNTITLLQGKKTFKGMNIRKKASDIALGEVAVSKGTYLKPQHLAAIASCGYKEISVYKKLNFFILATGDELIPVEQKPTEDKIRVSNIYSLLGEVLQLGQNVEYYGFINDDREKIKDSIKNALNSTSDIIITTGGVSVGDYDYLKEIYEELGVQKVFWRVFIKPGKPLYFGTYKKNSRIKLIFGLPGNPVSSQINFKVFIKENIQSLFSIDKENYIKAELLNDLVKKDKKRHFMRAVLHMEENKYFVTSKFSQSSGNLVELAKANCLIVIEEEYLNPKKGEVVKCLPM